MAIYYDNSWIKLPRDFTKWQWYHNSNMVHLYLYLLLKANIKDELFDGKVIHRGELITTLPKLSGETSLSPMVIRRCLKKMSLTKEISYKTFNKGRVIVLLDFNKYQTLEPCEDSKNWVQLYRSIIEWQYYSFPKMVHLMIHLRLKSCLNTLPNGCVGLQCHSSLKKLFDETGITIKSLRTCIGKLKQTGEITYERANKDSIITICNYGNYDPLNSLLNRQETGKEQTRNSLQNVLLTRANEEYSVTYCNTNTYNIGEQSTNSQRTVNEQSTNSQRTVNEQQIKEYKEYKENKDREFVDDARVPERLFSESEEIEVAEKENGQKKVQKESLSNIVKGDSRWLEAIMKKFHLPSLDVTRQKVDEFELDLICRGKEEHSDEKDFKCHFCDWLSKSNSIRMTRTSSSQGGEYRRERWPGELYVSSKGGDYEGKF